MKILVIHDNPLDPIVSLLAIQQSALKHNITLVSLQLFIEHMQVYDQINSSGVSIQWKLKDENDSTKIWTNHDTYLVNRCHQFPTIWNHLFHPDDREYAHNELTAYLNFAFTAFKYHIQPVSCYGLSGSVIPLFIQWDIVKRELPGLDVPSYYVGPYRELQWSKAVINPDPYDITYWVDEKVDHNIKKDYILAYQRPIGQPILVYITPIDAEVVKHDTFNKENKEKIDDELLKRFAMKVGQKLGIRLGEMLFFVSPKQVVFGSATPRIIHMQNAPHFKELTLQALTTESAYHDHNHYSFNHADKNGTIEGKSFIAIGSTKDSTIYNLVASQSFNKNGLLLPLEEFRVTWNFSYSNGCLTFFTKERCLESVSAIYYRPFTEQDNNNDALELLHNCLDNFDGIVYGNRRSQYLNSSKPMQLAHVLPTIRAHHSIVLPDTTIIKMIDHPAVISGAIDQKYITKSISGIRSIVVNNNVFDKWEKNSLNTLPTLFQLEIEGNDVRVHVCYDQILAVKITHKDVVDYRYAADFTIEEIILPEEVIAFCLSISHIEQNPLIGIDLIQTTNGYVFLEANPMPGWDFFYNYNAVSKERICDKIMKSP